MIEHTRFSRPQGIHIPSFLPNSLLRSNHSVPLRARGQWLEAGWWFIFDHQSINPFTSRRYLTMYEGIKYHDGGKKPRTINTLWWLWATFWVECKDWKRHDWSFPGDYWIGKHTAWLLVEWLSGIFGVDNVGFGFGFLVGYWRLIWLFYEQ